MQGSSKLSTALWTMHQLTITSEHIISKSSTKILAAKMSQRLDYEVFPKSERLIFKCGARDKMFSAQYHVFGESWQFCKDGVLPTGNGRPFLGDMLALAMTSDLLPLKQGWRSESIIVYAELELMTCATCHKPAMEVCNGCRRICHCGSTCQHFDWKRHKPLCKAAASSEELLDADQGNTVVECSSEARDRYLQLECLAERGDTYFHSTPLHKCSFE